MSSTYSSRESVADRPAAAVGGLHELAERFEQLEQVCPEAIQLLRTVRTASPSVRRLALGTAPLHLRTALIMAGLCTDERDTGGPACELTPDGLAVLERVPPLSVSEQQELSHKVDERLASLSSAVDPGHKRSQAEQLPAAAVRS
jgi:hypothetical protein